MKILILNGSPRANGSTATMVQAFASGAKESGHEITVIDVGRKKIAGCMGCEYCHTKENGCCIQKDDEEEVYEPSILQYQSSIVEYYNVKDMGVMTVNETDNRVEDNIEKITEFGRNI